MKKKMKNLKEIDFNEKTALIRCDFNVPIDEKGEILDDFRIRESISTIREVINQGGKAVLIGHIAKKVSLEIFSPIIEELLKKKVNFIRDIDLGTVKKIKKANFGEIFLLENLRVHNGEKDNNEEFANKLSRLGDIYINEAFSVCHREHASIVWLPSILPNCAGLKLIQEVKVLSKIKDKPQHPLVVIVGGSKVPSKIRVIQCFAEKADHILLGGEVANEILVVKGISPNRPWPDEEVVREVKNIEFTSIKIHLPVDLIVSPFGCNSCSRVDAPGQVRMDEGIYDIGPETIKIYLNIIKEAKMIIWAGPLGLFEKKEYEKGTREIAQAIALNNEAFTIIGGGDTGMAITKFNLRNSVDHISTGGGAMLEFMTGRELPGLKALGYYKYNNEN